MEKVQLEIGGAESASKGITQGAKAALGKTAQSARVAPTWLVSFIDRQGERAADSAWHVLKRRPYFGVVMAAGLAFGAASAIGIAELALTVGAGYAAFQVLRMGVPPSEAIKRARRLEEELCP
jgi:hypothetical protein